MTRTCKICGQPAPERRFTAREMMFGLRDEFEYFECAGCGCVQISEFPANLEKYYPANYSAHERRPFVDEYGRQPALKRRLRDRLAEHDLGHRNLIGQILAAKYRSGLPRWIRHAGLGLHLDSAILEVGAGAGEQLLQLRRCGFRNLLGLDPFIPADIAYDGGVKIVKRDLAAERGVFDFIMLHHSFEHMPDPREVCRLLRSRLRAGGWVLIRIPVGGCHAWKKYGVNWVQLDAPRHFFLHTEKSLRLVAEPAGLEFTDVVCDSKGFQLWGSEQYLRDVPLKDARSPFTNPTGQTLFTAEQLAGYAAEAEQLNTRREGDQACFYFRAR
ncbi:MAG: class I SAM-dependent methyltransferase [Verrucomicrobia bacterium]|nr:class I SAM-dependent methyltransferase [Verrucomicrobiota bacterium]